MDILKNNPTSQICEGGFFYEHVTYGMQRHKSHVRIILSEAEGFPL